jgi:hypothetical protein
MEPGLGSSAAGDVSDLGDGYGDDPRLPAGYAENLKQWFTVSIQLNTYGNDATLLRREAVLRRELGG